MPTLSEDPKYRTIACPNPDCKAEIGAPCRFFSDLHDDYRPVTWHHFDRIVSWEVPKGPEVDVSDLTTEWLEAEITVHSKWIREKGSLSAASTLKLIALFEERHRRVVADHQALYARLGRAQSLLRELELLEPDNGTSFAGWSFEVDDVIHDDATGDIVTVYGTATGAQGRKPYILGEA